MEIKRRDAVFEEKSSAQTRRNPESEGLRAPKRPRLDERGGSEPRENGEAQVGHHRPANRHPDRAKRRQQVKKQPIGGKLQVKEFAPAPNRQDLLPRQPPQQLLRGWDRQSTLPQEAHRLDLPSNHSRLPIAAFTQDAGKRFDFGQFRHDWKMLSYEQVGTKY